MWDKSPIRSFQNQLSSCSCPTQEKELQHPPWNQRKVSGGKEIWRSLIQVLAQSRTNFNIRSACSVKIWKSPKTMILQPVLAPVPVLIHPHYENVFLLCPTKYSGSPKLLHIQPQKCWVEGNNNLLWPAIYTLITAARYTFSPPCCKGMLPHSFSIFAHWEPLVFFRATPQPASPHPSVLHRDHFNRWKILDFSLLNFRKFCHPISPCPWGPLNGSSALQWVSHSPEFGFIPEVVDIFCTIVQVTDDQVHPSFWLCRRNREL